MHAELLPAVAIKQDCPPGPSRWLVVAAVWVLIAAIDHASRRADPEGTR